MIKKWPQKPQQKQSKSVNWKAFVWDVPSAPLWPNERGTDCFLWTVWRLDQSRLFKQQQLLGKVSQFRFQGLNVQKQNWKPLLSPSVSLRLMFSSSGRECIRETGLDWCEWAGNDTDSTTSRSVGLQQVPLLSGSTRVREMEKERLCFLLIGSCLPPPTTLKPHNTRGQRATGPACRAFLAFQSCF